MSSVMKLRSTSKLVERACLSSGFGANVSQEGEREVPGKINQQFIDTSMLNNDDLRLNPYSKEFIPQSDQRQVDYHAYPTLSMILNPSAVEFTPHLINPLPRKTLMFNPSAEEFIPQLINSLPKKTLMFNPSAEEFIPKLVKSLPKETLIFNPNAEEFTPKLVKSLPKRILIFNPSVEEFIPQLINSLPKKTLMFNPSAEEFTPKLVKSLPKETLIFNPSAEEFTPKLIKSLSKKTLMFNPSAEEFLPQLIKSLPKKTLMFNPNAEEFTPKLVKSLPKETLIFNPSAEEFIPKLIKSLSKKTLMFNLSAEEFLPQLIKSLLKKTLMFNPNAEEFTPKLIKSLPQKTLMFNPSVEEFTPHLVKSLPKRTLMFNPSAEEFIPQLIKSLPKTTLMFNPSAEEFIPQLIKSPPIQTLMFNPSAKEFTPKLIKSFTKMPLMFNPSAEEFIPQLIKSLPKKPLMFNTSAEEFIAHVNAQSIPMSNLSAEEIIPQLSVQSYPKMTQMINPSLEEFIPKLVSQSLPKHPLMINPSSESRTLNSCCEELRKCTSDETNQNIPQNHSALDVYNNPVTSNAEGSSILRRSKGKLRKIFLEECNEDVAEEDNQTACHSQEESQPTRSRILNPSAKSFISLVRHASPSSCNTNEISASLEQKHSELDKGKTALTQRLKELLRKLTNNSRLAQKESFRKKSDEYIEHDADDGAQTAGNSGDPQLTESQKLNLCAKICIPHPTDMLPVLMNTEEKNYNLEEIHTLSNADNRPISFELTAVSSECPNGNAHVIEDTVEAKTTCPSLEDHFDFSTYQVESSTLNSNAKTCMPLFRNMSQVSVKLDSYNAKSSGELSETSLHNSEIQRGCALLSDELNQGKFHPSPSADDKRESGSVLNGEVAMSSSTDAQGDTPTPRSTTVTAAGRTVADVNNLTPAKMNVPNGDFRRTPRRPNKRPMPQNDEFINIIADVNNLTPAKVDLPNKDFRRTPRRPNKRPMPQNAEFVDNPSQQFSALLEHGATVTDEADHDPTSLAVRLERAETEAKRLRLKVYTMMTDHALERTQHQLQIKILHKKMTANKKELANMQVLMLDLMKQVAISREGKKLMRAGLHVTHLYETMGDQVSSSEMQDRYQVLSSYMTECNLLKLDIEMLAQKLQEKLQNGKQIDLSVMEKYPPSFPEMCV